MRHLQLVCFGLFFCQAVFAQSPPPSAPAAVERTPEEQAAFEKLQRAMLALGKSYTGIRESDGEKLTPLDAPLQRWTNPLLGIEHGSFVGWKDSDGRPMAVAQIYKWSTNPQWFMEHQSLSPALMSFESPGNTTWRPRKPGIEWHKLDKNVPKPTSSKSLRLAQLKSISRRFTATDTNDSGESRNFRLLTTPSMRYAVEKDGILEGALFTFVSGTDPDVLLLLELRQDKQDDSGKSGFYWALAPMSTGRLTGYLDEEVVWKHHERNRSADTTFFPHPVDAPPTD